MAEVATTPLSSKPTAGIKSNCAARISASLATEAMRTWNDRRNRKSMRSPRFTSPVSSSRWLSSLSSWILFPGECRIYGNESPRNINRSRVDRFYRLSNRQRNNSRQNSTSDKQGQASRWETLESSRIWKTWFSYVIIKDNAPNVN